MTATDQADPRYGLGVLSGDRWRPQDDLLDRMARAASGLVSLGVGPGDSVAIMLRNDPAFIEVSRASALLGAVPTPINWHWRGDEVGYLLSDCGARVLAIHSDLLPNVAGSIPAGVSVIAVATPPEIAATYHVGPGDPRPGAVPYDDWLDAHEPWSEPPRPSPGSMIYTSGTTGRPKGVQREVGRADQAARTLWMLETIFGLRPGVRTIIPAPMYHSAPNAYALSASALGAFMVLMPRFDPVEFLELIERHGITHVQVVPTMFVRLLHLSEEVRGRYDLSSLEFVVHAAAPCPVDIKRRVIDWLGPVVWEYYGCTESGAVVLCSSEEWLSHPGTVGRSLDGAVVRIFDPDGEELGPGESGDVYVRLLDTADFTYRNDPEKRAGIEREGLITCGDIGYLDGDGYLYLNDRRSDMVISGGVNIYPAEIEAALLKLPGVRDCAVFGIPDDEYGEALAAHIELDGTTPVSADAVRDHIRRDMAGYKVPKVVEFADELPREDSGKIFKRRLREPYWAGREKRI